MDAVYDNDTISSKHYKLLSGDLRDMATVGDKLLTAGIDPRYEYSPISELALIQMHHRRKGL